MHWKLRHPEIEMKLSIVRNTVNKILEYRWEKCTEMCTRKIITIIFILTTFILGYILLLTVKSEIYKPTFHFKQQNILDCLTAGKFVKLDDVNVQDHKRMHKFIQHVWKDMLNLTSIQRPDGKCGNAGFTNNFLSRRALCDPEGPTPCCFKGKCIAAKELHCRCADCYDLRQRIIPELSTWKPDRANQCQLTNYTSKAACDLLHKHGITYIVVIGDSLLRHLYSAIGILLKNDPQTGCLKPDISEQDKKDCAGYAQFTEKKCNTINLQVPMTVCGDKIELHHVPAYHIPLVHIALQAAMEATSRKNSLIILGVGLHHDLNWKLITDLYVRPFVRLLNGRRSDNTSKWPLLLWVSPHFPGLLKPPMLTKQDRYTAHNYRYVMEQFLHDNGINSLNTQDLTKDTLSWDGTHQGFGVNMLLAQFVMNYVDSFDVEKEFSD